MAVLGGISVAHLLNDLIQSLLVAIYPLLQADFALSFLQVGLITLTYQITASLLQPLIGRFTDRHPLPYSLPVGMTFTLSGLLLLSRAPSYPVLLLAAALVGVGSSVFHPESSRVARMASGGQFGLAQSVFQIGGNAGSALGPLLAAWVILGRGREHVAWFAIAALVAIVVLVRVSGWYARSVTRARAKKAVSAEPVAHARGVVARAMVILTVLCFSKFVYMASISTYYEFYLMDHFRLSLHDAQLALFAFLGAVALGTIIGGPIGDRVGRKRVIWVSILGVAPFTLALPYVGLEATIALSVVIGVVLASAFPAIVVFGQELMPEHIGAVSGLFYGLSFGLGGLAAAGWGWVADLESVEFVYRASAFLPLLGLAAVFLPDVSSTRVKANLTPARSASEGAPQVAKLGL